MAVDGLTMKQIQSQPAIKHRLSYLSINLVLMVLSLLYGGWVYQFSKSLTLKIDAFTIGCEVLAVLINITIEFCKVKQVKVRSIVLLDLVGGILSLLLLVAVGVIGVVGAMAAREEIKELKKPPVFHLHKLLGYAAFAVSCSVANLGLFVCLRDSMLPRRGSVHDQLNILSNLAHSVIDFVTNLAVLGTAIWLQYGVSGKNWLEMRLHKEWVDVFGACMVCSCIIISICFLLREVVRAIRFLAEQCPADEVNFAIAEKTASWEVLPNPTRVEEGRGQYGTVENQAALAA